MRHYVPLGNMKVDFSNIRKVVFVIFVRFALFMGRPNVGHFDKNGKFEHKISVFGAIHAK